MSEGVFQTDRAIFDNPVWKNILKFRLFFYIYGNAVYTEDGIKYSNIHVKRGQLLRSYRKLQEGLEYIENHAVKQYSLSQIKRTIDELVNEGRLTKTDTELGTLFTICNYEEYQGFERFKKSSIEQRKNTERTLKEQMKNNNKKDNKDNKDNKDKNKDIYSSSHMTMAEKLKSLILSNNPNAKTPTDLTKWAIEFERMERLDKRTPEQIYMVMEFSQKDSFWKSNILSAKKLREQFDRLWLQKDRTKPTQPKFRPPNMDNFKQRKYTKDDFKKLYKEV